MEGLSRIYQDNVARFDELLGVGRSCDMVARDFRLGGRRARIWVVDGYGRDAILERMGAFWLGIPAEGLKTISKMQDFIDRFITFSETDVSFDVEDIVTSVLLGKTLFLLEGAEGAALIDAKDYPSRGVGEPEDGKVLRGSHDGFVEAVVPNMALLRRRIRDPELTMEGHKVGTRSRTDVVLCYLRDRADPKLLDRLRDLLSKVDVHSLSLGQESLAEAIRPKQWYNPFPKTRYTERPDTAAATVMEGGVVVLVDNSPSAILLPTSLFGFTQEANDFYFPPLVGTYLRILRMGVFLLSLFVTPVWYLLASVPERIPDWLTFIAVPDPCKLSLFAQLILGDFAVQAEWLSPEVLVYMAFVSVSGFTQPSYEMDYAFKLLRLLLLLLSAAFDLWGFGLGLLGIVILLATCKPIAGGSYLYPLVPFDGKAMRRLIFREPISKDNT